MLGQHLFYIEGGFMAEKGAISPAISFHKGCGLYAGCG